MKTHSQRFFSYLKKPLVYLPLALIIIGTGVYAYTSKSSSKNADIFTVTSGEFLQSVAVTGKVVPAENVNLGFETSGRVASVNVTVGQIIRAGQTIAYLSNGDLAATIEQRQAQLQAEEAKLAQLQRGARPEDIQVAETNYRQAKSVVVDAIRDGYSRSDDALRNRIDQLYTDPRGPLPRIMATDDYQLTQSLNDQRLIVGDKLKSWNTSVTNLTVETYDVKYVVEAQANLKFMQNYLNDLTRAVSSFQAGAVSQATIDKYRNDISSARTSINTAVSSLNNAISALQQSSDQLTLKRAGSTKEDIDAQTAQVGSAQAQVSSARASIGKTVISAPFDGVVTKADIKAGEIASPNTPVFSLISASQYQVESYISENDIAKVKVAQTAKVTLDAYGKDVSFDAKVTEVDPAETIIGGISTYKIKLQFVASDERIKSGMTANISIETANKPSTIVIPQEALFLQGGEKTVTVREGDKDVNRKVVTGSINTTGDIEVLSGLSAGDKIVLKK